MPEIGELRSVCQQAASAGARELLAWNGRFSCKEKNPRDLVTDADLASQKAIYRVIREKYPDHGFLGEEDPDPSQLQKQYCWIVDPLDGTTNYVHGYPFYAVSVAVAREGVLTAGAVFDPLRKECFLAAAGCGSQLNGEPISVSSTITLEEALVAVSLPPDLQIDSPDLQAFLQVAPRCRAVRRTGSAALNLAYVASGRLDAHWAHFIYSWDSAAGVLLVLEAGGVATACRGGNYQVEQGDYFVSGTRQLHRTLLPMISGVSHSV